MNRRRILDFDKYGEDGEKLLEERRGKVFEKVKSLERTIQCFSKSQDKYVVLVNHLYAMKEFYPCEMHAQNWFMMLLLLHDKSQLIQTGKFQFPIYQLTQMEADDIICTEKIGDFVWGDHNERHQLNLLSYQGYAYSHKELINTMKKHDVSSCPHITLLFIIGFFRLFTA